MNIWRMEASLEEDYAVINWNAHAPMARLWLEVDERHKAGEPVAGLLAEISYRCPLNRRWPRIDCMEMVPGLALSARAKEAFESLRVPGMQFLEFRINDDPFFLFYTERRVDCLDRSSSEIEFFRSSPDRVMRVSRYAFVENCLRECDVFTVPERSSGMFFWVQETYLTEAARAAIVRHNLIGLRFETLP